MKSNAHTSPQNEIESGLLLVKDLELSTTISLVPPRERCDARFVVVVVVIVGGGGGGSAVRTDQLPFYLSQFLYYSIHHKIYSAAIANDTVLVSLLGERL